MRAPVRAGLLVMSFATLLPATGFAQTSETQTAVDSALAARVEMALRAASDLPADSLRVVAVDGRVDVIGSVMCDGCGGTSTPGGTGTVQQNLGAIVRAVPGVEQVRFYVRYRPR